MSSAIESFSPKEWEGFCEVMLRQHYGQKQFYTVPDEDGGDLGLEFFTVDGTLFQCYYPDSGVEMKVYKQRVQKKINDDLKKLKINEDAISKLLDEIKINQWVILIPENKSKELIAYCNKKRKETLLQNISYIDQSSFSVKIETADSYPAAKLYALGTYNSTINIPIFDVTATYKENWKDCNSEFMKNIVRKSNNLMGIKASGFEERVVEKYIQTEKLLEQLRVDHPDLH
jgi:stalled ribosome rescue protein Dom34